jgi:NAD dependent epimerase/dehydratase
LSWTQGRVLVTGADGFIGSHLVEMLVREGASVTALTLYNSFNDWGWLETIEARDSVRTVAGDVRDSHFCDSLLEGIDIVLHLAALIPIPYSYVAPDSFVDVNVKGTLNICQAARRHRTRRIVHTSTSEVYGTARYVPMDEAHPLHPQSPYAATKVAADALALSFYRSFEVPLVVARPFNTYGPRQSARAVISAIIAQLAGGDTEVRLGDLTATRDFTYVEDTCRGLLAIATMPGGYGEVFHIGSDMEISIGTLCEEIARLMDLRITVVPDSERMRPKMSEVRQLRCSYEKLRQATGFSPRTTLDEGLRRTIAWFREPANLRRYKSNIYNV